MNVLRTAILDFCRRKKGTPFYPSEIVRQMYPEDWELFVDDLKGELSRMHKEDLIDLRRDGKPLGLKEIPDGLLSISLTGKPK
jgi:hypothetical protein